MPTDHGSSDGQRQCRRRGASVDVELHAAMALADMAGAGAAAEQQARPAQHAAAPQEHEEEAELASTRLSLELGNVGIRSSPCSSSSSGAAQPAAPQAAASATVPGYCPRPRHMLTEAEKEAKRLRRVLANRESARQTILRRQAIRDELARKVADLASQNENMKKEKDMVLEQYLSLKETNKQLKEQVAKTTTKKKAPSTPATTAMDIAPPAQQHAEASPLPTPPQPSFLYSAPPSAVPVPYVWGSWPPCGAGYEHGASNPAGAPTFCLSPACAWYYPVVAADPRGSPSSYVQPFHEPRSAAEPTSGGGSPRGGTAGEDTDDDPCSLTLAIDADRRSAAAGANTY